MRLIFVRHGQPEWQRDGVSVDNPGLTEIGHQQAALLAKRFQDEELDEILVSPLVRAQQTAAPIAEALGREVTTLDWLAEIRAPMWEGTPAETVERIFRESRERPIEQHWDGLPGGESFRDFHVRVTTGIDGMLRAIGAEREQEHPPLWRMGDPNRRVMIVAHGGTNATSLGHLLGIQPVPWEWERFISFHASVSLIEPMQIGGSNSFSLFRFSDIGHLPVEMQTL